MSPDSTRPVLPEHDAFLERCLGLRRKPTRPGPVPSAQPLLARLKSLTPQLRAATADSGPSAQDLKRLIGELQALTQQKDYGRAALALEKIEALLAAPPADGPRPAEGRTARAQQLWRDAKDAVDRQIVGLQDLLRKAGDAGLAQVADSVGTIMGRFKSGMTAALLELDKAGPADKAKARDRAAAILLAYQKHLATDRFIAGADANPFGVKVTIRETLGGALKAVQAELAPLK
jgi:hypothetical protein